MKFERPEKFVPVLFALLTVAAYGLLLPFTGFYWDDWPFAWIAKFLGPGEFFPAFAGVRPFLAPIFFATTSLIPPVPLYWQSFALVVRFVSGLSAWFAFRQIWSSHKKQALIAALLFLVFPGYSQHWVAFTHINQEWIPFIFYLLSFGFTARALRQADTFKPNTVFALLLLVAGVLPTEYFIGLEPLRFFFIWVIISDEIKETRHRFVRTLKLWLPYLLIWLGNGAWLAYFYTIGNYDSYGVDVTKTPPTILETLSMFGDAIWKGGFYIWGQILALVAKSLTAPASLLTLGLIAITFIFLLVYLSNAEKTEGAPNTFAGAAILAGIAGLALGRLPSFAAGLPLTLQSGNDRFMISMMIGGTLFVAGLVEALIKNPRAKNYAFALLIAFGVGQQFFNANIFRRDWEKQQEIYWQLAWRIPAIKPNTALLTDAIPIDYETGVSFTAPLNWMYAPDYNRSDLPYALVYTETHLGRATLPSLERDVEINMGLRTASFHGSTDQVIVIDVPKNGCLRVLDPARGDQSTYSKQSHYLTDAIPLSDPSNIIVDHEQTPELPFLSEPKHTWCYYFAKAELAYQKKEFDRVIEIIDEASARGYRPEDPFEWLGYIEAQALAGDIEKARELSNTAFAREQRPTRAVRGLEAGRRARRNERDREASSE